LKVGVMTGPVVVISLLQSTYVP